MSNDIARGLLCIWTDVDPEHDADFNRWYDREHMQERVAIPGFQNARRFAAVGPCPRPYLALYVTDSLDVFGSAPYARAFANQTLWSLQSFERMRGTQRRVGTLAVETGAGEGGALALFVVPAALREDGRAAALSEALATVVQRDHIVRAALLETDVVRSTPLTAGATPAPADALVMIEATRAEAAALEARALSVSLGLPSGEVYTFQTLWRLASTDLFRKET